MPIDQQDSFYKLSCLLAYLLGLLPIYQRQQFTKVNALQKHRYRGKLRGISPPPSPPRTRGFRKQNQNRNLKQVVNLVNPRAPTPRFEIQTTALHCLHQLFDMIQADSCKFQSSSKVFANLIIFSPQKCSFSLFYKNRIE